MITCKGICRIIVCLIILTSPAIAQDIEKEKAAIAAAEQWLLLVDGVKYSDSWEEAAELFRNAITQEQWYQSLKAVRDPLGKLVSRELDSKLYKRSLPGAPDGEYMVIQFRTSFENKKTSIETITPMLEKDGRWRVSGYYIK